MTTRMDASVTYTHTWDTQNRLSGVTAAGKDTAWVYDADGARAIKVNGPITTVYVGGSVEIQISGTLRLTTTYYFFGGARIAMQKAGALTYLHGDRIGSASLATDAAGNVLSQERYYVWGSASMMSGTMPSEFQFQNQRRLDDTQMGRLYDFNARFFSPVLANFISPDSIVPNPANPQSLNRYAALANNPLKFTDPTGHYEACDDGACTSSSSTRNGLPVGGIITGRRYFFPSVHGSHIITRTHGHQIDPNHADLGIAAKAIKQVSGCYMAGSGSCDIVIAIRQDSVEKAGMTWPPGCRTENGGCNFEVKYTLEFGFKANEILGLSLAMYMDAQTRFELAQERIDWPLNSTSFHFEDLFSDYVGFVRAASGKSLDQVVSDSFGGQSGESSEMASFVAGFFRKSTEYDPAFGSKPVPGWYRLPDSVVIKPIFGAKWRFVSSTPYAAICGTNCK